MTFALAFPKTGFTDLEIMPSGAAKIQQQSVLPCTQMQESRLKRGESDFLQRGDNLML